MKKKALFIPIIIAGICLTGCEDIDKDGYLLRAYKNVCNQLSEKISNDESIANEISKEYIEVEPTLIRFSKTDNEKGKLEVFGKVSDGRDYNSYVKLQYNDILSPQNWFFQKKDGF